MLFYFLIAVIIIALLVIIVIIVRKFSILAAIETKTIPGLQTQSVKERIILERLSRKCSGFKNKLLILFLPLGIWLKAKLQCLYEKILALERKYKKIKPALTEEEAGLRQQKIRTLFQQVEELWPTKNYQEIEKKYIEIITLDPQNIVAYRQLGNLYSLQKDYRQAAEAYKFILKLNPEEAETWADLGLIYQARGQLRSASKCFKKAVALVPNNPKHLDSLIEVAIIMKDKKTAQKAFEKLQAVNPENQKLGELAEKITKIEKEEQPEEVGPR